MTAASPLPGVFADVDLWLAEIATWPADRIREVCDNDADLVAGADSLLWQDPTKRHRKQTGGLPADPEPSDVADALARGIAVLATAPGGVTVFDRHWCTPGTPDHDVECPGPGGRTDLQVRDRKQTGAHYTPRSLADEISVNALEPLVYQPGPLQTSNRDEWKLKCAADIIALDVGDITVGAGVFLISAIRYLSDRVLNAWAAEGTTGDLTAARRAVIRGVHGADIDGLAVEFAKVAVWLVTFDPSLPNQPLDQQIIAGDSLLGITDLQQLAWMHVDAERGKALHEADPSMVVFPRHLATCITVTTRRLAELKHTPGAGTVETLIVQATVDLLAELAKPLADLIIGAALASGCKARKWDKLSLEAAQMAAAWWLPAPAGPVTVPLTMPTVYAAPDVQAAEPDALFSLGTAADEADTDWHITDPTTDRARPGIRSEPTRTWFMCGRLHDASDVTCTRTAPSRVCGNCLTQVDQVNAMLAAYLLAVTQALHAEFTQAGEAA